MSSEKRFRYFLFQQVCGKALLLCIFFVSINTITPLPATPTDTRAFHSVDHKSNADNLLKNSTPQGLLTQTMNSSTEHLLSTKIQATRIRRSAGCLSRTLMVPCGGSWIVTVECKKRSVTCIRDGIIAPKCISTITNFAACGKAFPTDCKCAS